MNMHLQKTFVIALLIASICTTAAAQNPFKPIPNEDWGKVETLDTAYLRVEYKMTFRDALFYRSSNKEFPSTHVFTDDQYVSDKRIVEIGKNVRKDYSRNLEALEQSNRELIDNGRDPYNIGKEYAYPYEYFIFNDGAVRTNARTLFNGPIIQFAEKEDRIDWKLTGNSAEVCGRQCSEARAQFHGRTYSAWFCSDIPVSAGPWKLEGLPGLILKAESEDGTYRWEMTGLEQGSWPIYEKQYNFRKCSEEEAERLFEDIYAHPFVFMEKIGMKTLMPDGKGGTRSPGEAEYGISMYYNPLEIK
jgi:GLPGLI family protein